MKRFTVSVFHSRKLFVNRALRVLLITNGMILLAAAMLGPIYAIFVEKIGGDLLDASLAGGVFAFIAGSTVLLSGKYSDRIPQKKFLVALGYILMGLGFLLYTVVNSVGFLLLVQVLIGFGEAIYSPPFDALFSEHLDKGESGTEWGTWEAMNYFAAASGAVIGGVLVSTFGFVPLFIIMATLCFSSAMIIIHLPRKVLG